jgi:hypothetical protein
VRVLLALSLLLLAGCASGPSLDHKRDVAVGPHGFAELNLLMESGAAITYSWNSTAPLEFNIHTHTASGVQDFAQETTAGKAGTFRAPAKGGYSLLWENKGFATIQLHYEASGSATVDA